MDNGNQVKSLREHIAMFTEEKKLKEQEIVAIRADMAAGKLRGDEALRIFDRTKRIKELERLIPKLSKSLSKQESIKQQQIF